MNRKRKRYAKAALAALCAVGVCAAIWALWKNGFLEKMRSVEQLREAIGAAGSMAGAAFFFVQMLTVFFAPIPSNVTMLAGALALGFFRAAVLGMLAVIAGSVLLFCAARKLGRSAVLRVLDRGVMDKYLPVIEEKQEMFLFLTMLFPFFPDDVLCILAGLSGMKLSHFVLIIALARPWGLIFAALLGGGTIRLPLWGWVLLILAMAAVFCLALRYSREIEARLLALIQRAAGKWKEKR